MNSTLMRGKSLALKAALIVATVIALKLLADWCGWEFISLNPLFSGIVAANVFLMGFLLSGVLADYKESERLPGELAASLEAIADEVAEIHTAKHAPAAKACLDDLLVLGESLERWFYKRERTGAIMERLSGLSRHWTALESLTQATFLTRLKQEQANIRRVVTRMHTIRETSFVPSGYMIADATTVCLTIGLILVKIDPFYECLFFVGLITFLLAFLILLIRDLDNPFGYYEGDSSEDVSLKPLIDALARLKAQADDRSAARA
jgi:hypothetical protein